MRFWMSDYRTIRTTFISDIEQMGISDAVAIAQTAYDCIPLFHPVSDLQEFLVQHDIYMAGGILTFVGIDFPPDSPLDRLREA